ncbi:unnamed protein product [Acanthosepion pharaonis]|uniref:Uncharacterized protein n=1 Tax=Acanthosepion pharaonis TaxID=158019 RepID=A0A812C7D9_ACAPH|nr:unnamed protein product [Sepia pharaonis]
MLKVIVKTTNWSFSLCYFYPFFLSLFSYWSSLSLSSHFCIDNHSLLYFNFFLNEIKKMASSLRNEIKESKKHLVDLQEDVEEFEKRLRRGIEQTKKSIEQLSIDCDVNCSKVWQEFDEFLEKTWMKAAELCNQMREKTSEEERKWRQILEEKENLLEEAGKWLLDLRHLFAASNDDEDVISGVRSLGAEISGRLHESFFPVEEGHFDVTFPEWCQRSLNQLQKEIVDFKTVKTWHPRELELESEFRLRGSNLAWIRSIAASEEDGHVFVVDRGDYSIKEFGGTGEFVGRCPLTDEGLLPLDICCLSQDNFVVYSPPPPASKFHSSLSLISPPPTFPPSLYLFMFFNANQFCSSPSHNVSFSFLPLHCFYLFLIFFYSLYFFSLPLSLSLSLSLYRSLSLLRYQEESNKMETEF